MFTTAVYIIKLWEVSYSAFHFKYSKSMTTIRRALPFIAKSTAVIIAIGYVTKGHYWNWVPSSFAKLEEAERRIYDRANIPPYKMTKIASLGTVCVPCTNPEKNARESAKDLVLIHGFAAGNALWATNIAELAKHFNVYAVEWIGCGRSDRPDFDVSDFNTTDAFIIKTIEDWRKEAKLDKFHLCAHSMGAIFASSYTLRYPENVEHLVLVSPAGVSHPPPPMPETVVTPQISRRRSWLRNFAVWLWDKQLTPMSLARFAGPYGPDLVKNIMHRRISFMPQTSALRNGSMDTNDLGEYVYHNWALKPSGERFLHTYLAPMAYAKHPLIDRLIPEKLEKLPYLTFIYGGESDWMDYRHGLEVVKAFQAKKTEASLHLVPYSGHNLFLDNPKDFNRIVTQQLLKA